MRFASFVCWSTLAAAPLRGQVVDSAVPIPMRDGVVLRATVLRPSREGRFPVLVYRTPYGQASAVTGYSTFGAAVKRGYAVVAQDVRGRYLSDGAFDPYRQEGRDGYDTIEWAAAQPWSEGRVGTFGLSYPGAVQWLAAVETPPHLVAMVPAMTFSRPTNFWYAGGVTDLSWPAWIWLNIGPDVRRRQGLPGPTTGREARATWASLGPEIANRLPITDVPELDLVAPWLKEWYTHPPDDPWWRWADLTTKYSRVKAAVLNLSAWHDDNYGPEGALTNHLGMVREGQRGGGAAGRSYLILGPWVHGVAGINDRTANAKSGERVFGAAAGLDYDEEILRFMDHFVRGRVSNESRDLPSIRVFVMGENVWRTADTWPLPGTRPTTLYLTDGPPPAPTLDWSPSQTTERRTITSDPAAPVVDPHGDRSGAHDYRELSRRPDVLVYETAPLDRDVRVVGTIEARITFQTDAPSIDVWTKLLDVAPDGTAWNVMSAGLDVQRSPPSPGTDPSRPRTVTIGTMMTGNLFERGHRIRLVVMNSFMPNFGRNPQTGRPETIERTTRPATFSVLTGPTTPSTLTLPIIP
jgi:putative CocE/NonD family hydrolase